MAQYATENIRTVALVGHGAAGKTTLAEALLLRAKAIQAAGSVERGTTVSDFDPLEKTWQHSLRASVLHFDSDGTRVHMIDTPGFPDFIGQAIGALDAVETAAVVVNAQAGIEMITSRMMDWTAQAQALPARDRQQDRRRERRPRSRARRDPGDLRQGMPADQPARRRRQAGGRLLLQSVRRIRFLVGGRCASGAGRSGRRGRRGADVALPRAGRDRAGSVARAVRAGAARRPPGAGVLRLGAHRRRRGASCSTCW